MTGTRKPNSLIGRLRQFFHENPDEELTFPDVAAKFDTTIEHAWDAAKRMRQKGEIECAYVMRPTHRLRSPGEPVKQGRSA